MREKERHVYLLRAQIFYKTEQLRNNTIKSSTNDTANIIACIISVTPMCYTSFPLKYMVTLRKKRKHMFPHGSCIYALPQVFHVLS